MSKNQIKTNMSVKNCDFSDDFYDRKLFKIQNEPQNKYGYTFINPNCISKSYDKTFEELNCPITFAGEKKKTYVTNDPRLISASHSGQILPLDRPPINESIKLSEIYTNPDMKYYGQEYKTYSDINAGQILYYYDHSIEDALYEPIFENNARVEASVYKDPMSAMKPEYNRIPIINTNVLNTKKNTPGVLSWIRDSQESREDIMSKQMSLFNRTKYSSRWTGNLIN